MASPVDSGMMREVVVAQSVTPPWKEIVVNTGMFLIYADELCMLEILCMHLVNIYSLKTWSDKTYVARSTRHSLNFHRHIHPKLRRLRV